MVPSQHEPTIDLAQDGIDWDRLPVVFGRYLLQRRIGEGGMGTVFSAEHTSLRQRVALKTIKSTQLSRDNQLAVRRFYREIEAAGAVIHPNVARATDAGEEFGVHFLVTEYVDGIDLRDLTDVAGALPLGAACEIMRQAFAGLQAIHEQQLVHRDIKPSNILVSWTGCVKIVDLGLARIAREHPETHQITNTGAILGTVDYLAPEQARSAKTTDIRADIYSIGCSLYRVLTNKPVFGLPDYTTATERILAHINDTPNLSPIDGFGTEVKQLIERLLAKDPNERFGEPSEAVAEFTKFANPNELQEVLTSARKSQEDVGLSWQAAELVEGSDTQSFAIDGTNTHHEEGDSRPLVRLRSVALVAIFAVSIAVMAGYLFRNYGSAPVQETSAVFVESHHSKEESSGPVIEPPAEPSGDSREVKSLDSLPLNQWHNLMEVEPRRVIWESGTEFLQPVFDSASQQLNASCNFGLLEFGKTQAESYTIQVGISQQRWLGGPGLFFGGRIIDHQGHPAFQCQCLKFAEERIGTRTQVTLLREERIEMLDKKLKYLGTATAIAAESLGALQGEQILEITIVDDALRKVTINGRPAPAVTSGDANSHFSTEDYRGGFGPIIEISGAVFRNARFMASK